MFQLNCDKISFLRLRNNVVNLDLAPFSEKVEKHWSRTKRPASLAIREIAPLHDTKY